MKHTALQTLVSATLRWYRTRGGPRRVERDAELALVSAVRNFIGD